MYAPNLSVKSECFNGIRFYIVEKTADISAKKSQTNKQKKKRILPDITAKLFVFVAIRNLKEIIILKHYSASLN